MEQKSALLNNTSNGSYKITMKKIARAAIAELRVHKKLAVITLVMYGVSAMFIGLDSNESEGFGILFAAFGVFVGFCSALNVFRDMNNRQLCDVTMALPIKASERFFSKVLCLFCMQIVPLVLSTFIGNGIKILSKSLGNNDISGATETMFKMLFCLLAASFFLMAVAVLCACCTGAFAESTYFSIILITIVHILPGAFIGNIISSASGFYSLNPFLFNGHIDLGYCGLWCLFINDKMIIHCLVVTAYSIAVMLLSGLIYKKRDAQNVGKPVSSRIFFEVVMTLICVTIFICFAFSNIFFFGVVTAAVAYIVINIIVIRAKIKIRTIFIWLGKYALITAACCGFLTAAAKTGGFGTYALRPDKVYLEDVTFSLRSYYNNSGGKTIQSDKLTPDQAEEVLDIFQKCYARHLPDRNPFSEIAYDGSLNVESDVEYGIQPSPAFQFRLNYNIGYGYHLSYYQALFTDSLKDIEEELMKTGYFHVINEDY